MMIATGVIAMMIATGAIAMMIATAAIAMMIATAAIAIGTMIGGAAMAVTATTRRWPINRAIRTACTRARMMAPEDRATIRNAHTFTGTDMVTAAVITETTDATVTVNSSRHIVKDFCKDTTRVIEATVDPVTGARVPTDVGRFKD